MNRARNVALGMVLVMTALPAVGLAAECPPEVMQASLRLMQASVPSTSAEAARSPLAGNVSGTREPSAAARALGQDTQAPRGQDTQAPRGQDTQAPRGQDTQAPRGHDKLALARDLVRQAQQACQEGNPTSAAELAKAALALLP